VFRDVPIRDARDHAAPQGAAGRPLPAGRVYTTVVTLVSLISLTDHIEDESSLSIAFSLWIMLIGLWTASMFADVAAHVATDAHYWPARDE